MAEDRTPNIIYHYTSFESAISILKSSCLFKTHVEYFNDPSELEFGAKIVGPTIDFEYNMPAFNLLKQKFGYEFDIEESKIILKER